MCRCSKCGFTKMSHSYNGLGHSYTENCIGGTPLYGVYSYKCFQCTERRCFERKEAEERWRAMGFIGML